MTAWLGIVILLAFSLGLNLFMRLEGEPTAEPAEELRRWRRVPGAAPRSGAYLEHRVIYHERRWLPSRRWVEQRRLRRESDGAILEVLEERPFRLQSPRG